MGAGTHGEFDGTPRADVSLPAPHTPGMPRRERRRSSVARDERLSLLRGDNPLVLKPLKDVPVAQKEVVFKQKLQLCSHTDFNWEDPEAQKGPKETKRAILLELVEYVHTAGGQKIFTETVIGDVISMVSANIFRAPPPPAPSLIPGGDDVAAGIASGGEDGDEVVFTEPSWPHLQLVYEFLLRFIVSAEVKAKTARRFLDTRFCSKLVDQFDSEDPRERDYLKTVLHRIYGKFMSHRGFIRKAIANVFYKFVYETEKHHGVAELLEILGSIINGFALPLKAEHVLFLEKALIPLHRPRTIAMYFQQLCYCVTQYLEKDPSTIVHIISGLLKVWPTSSSAKQIVFLSEMEELLELAGPEAVQPIMRPLFTTLARCVGSSHFQVAERSLFLWNNGTLLGRGILSQAHTASVLPLLYSSLAKQAAGHWNTTVETLARNVLKHYENADPAFYEATAAAAAREPEQRASEAADKASKWALVEQIAAKNRPGKPWVGRVAPPPPGVVVAR